VDSGLVYKHRADRNAADPEYNKLINIVSQAVKVHPITGDLKKGPTEFSLDYYEERLLGNLPTEGRILVEEYYKALYLNDQDPENYNFSYWLDYFKVSNVTLRNAFNYVFFPIPDENNPTEVGKILHFKDFEFANRRKMIAEMSKEEYKEYLEKTEERPELNEIKRLEYINLQTSAKQSRITERTIPTLDEEIEDNLEKTLINSEIIREIDNKIAEFVSLQIEEKGLVLDADVKLRLDEIKEKRKMLDYEKMKKIYENPELIETNKKIEPDSQKPSLITSNPDNQNKISEKKLLETIDQTLDKEDLIKTYNEKRTQEDKNK